MGCDVIVVGAGPAGCAAAYDLTTAGQRVLLVDRRSFPRRKPCGGGLTIKTLRRMRYSPESVFRHVSDDLVVGLRVERTDTLRSRHPTTALTVREEFDDFNLRRTIDAGAAFRVVSQIESIGVHAGGVTVVTADESLSAAFLIGADGVNSAVRRLVPGFDPLAKGFALETDVAMPNPPPMQFDFGLLPYGYGWLFPKGDHVNVGLFTSAPGVSISRQDVIDYARARLGAVPISRIIGHHVGLRGWETIACAPRVLLVGDAAGLVDPLLGEGIHNAIRSGQAAAASIIAALDGKTDATAEYQSALEPLLEDLRKSQRYATLFYDDVDAGYRLITARGARDLLMKGYACGLTTIEMRRRLFALATMHPPVIPGLVS